MKYFLLLILVATVSVAGYGQSVQSPAKSKTAIIRTNLFDDDKVGIISFIEALKPLDKEFQPADDEIKQIFKKYEEVVKDLRGVEALPNIVDVSPDYVEKKISVLEKLECDLTTKTKKARDLYVKRRAEVTKELMKDIARSIDEFATERSLNILLINDSTEPIFDGLSDVTLDFIKFYNSSPKKVSGKQQ